jgi:predicted secreted protein
MMRWVPVVALTWALLGACASAPLPPAVKMAELDNAKDGTRVVLERGGELKVLIDTNLSSGLQWDMPAKVAPVLAPIGQGIYVGKGAVRDVHLGGTNIFRFRAEAPGTTTLEFAHRRIGEPTAAPARTIHYEVIVP